MSEAVEQSDSPGDYKEVQLGPKAVKIPSEWTTRELDELTKNSGNYGANISAVEYDPEKPRYIRITDIGDDGFLKDDNRKSITCDDAEGYYLSAGDLLFARTGATAGKSYLCREEDTDSAYAGYLIRFELDESQVDPNFLALYVQSKLYDDWVDRITRHGAQQNINASEYRSLDILYPPLPEQRRIAEVLSTVDEQIQQTNKIIEETKELKRGLRDALVLGGLSDSECQQFRVGPFDFKIPDYWKKTTVKECAENLDSDRVPVKKKDRQDMTGDIPYYGASGQIDSVNDWLFDEELLLLAEDGENLLSREKPVAFKISGKAWVNNHAHVLKPNSDMDIDYLLNYLEILNYEPYATGTAQPKLNQKVLNAISVPKPPISEQESIAEILGSVEEKIDQESSRRLKLEELKKGLMQDLLTGKVRVNPDN